MNKSEGELKTEILQMLQSFGFNHPQVKERLDEIFQTHAASFPFFFDHVEGDKFDKDCVMNDPQYALNPYDTADRFLREWYVKTLGTANSIRLDVEEKKTV